MPATLPIPRTSTSTGSAAPTAPTTSALPGAPIALRVAQHDQGLDRKAWTYRRRPVEMVWAERYDLALQAIACERQLKGWSRAKKEALIRGDWATIQDLARGGAPRPSTGSG